MKKDRIHIYEMESYKHASEEQRNSMRICKIRYFDLEGLPSKEVKEILEAFMGTGEDFSIIEPCY